MNNRYMIHKSVVGPAVEAQTKMLSKEALAEKYKGYKAYVQMPEMVIGIRNQSENDDTAVIDIDGIIGWDFWKWLDDAPQTTSESVKALLSEIKSEKIIVNINSPGGDVNDGLMIHDLLSEHPAHVTTIVRGMTASAGTIIAMAGDLRKMSENATFLPHNAYAGLAGWFNRFDLAEIKEDLDKICHILAGVYARSGTKSPAEYEAIIDEKNGRGSWFTAAEALEHGFIDEIFDPKNKGEAPDETDDTEKNITKNLKNEAVDENTNAPNQVRSAEDARKRKISIIKNKVKQ